MQWLMIVRSVDQVGRFAVVISSSPLRTDTLVVSWTVAGGQQDYTCTFRTTNVHCRTHYSHLFHHKNCICDVRRQSADSIYPRVSLLASAIGLSSALLVLWIVKATPELRSSCDDTTAYSASMMQSVMALGSTWSTLRRVHVYARLTKWIGPKLAMCNFVNATYKNRNQNISQYAQNNYNVTTSRSSKFSVTWTAFIYVSARVCLYVCVFLCLFAIV